MTNQEKEIRNLNKIIAIQGDLLKMNKDILIPMYKHHIKQLEDNIKDLLKWVITNGLQAKVTNMSCISRTM